MRFSRVAVLGVAITAGLAAALMVGRSQPAPAPAPVAAAPARVATVDVLVAAQDLPAGRTLTAADLRWQAWPVEAATAGFLRATEAPKALGETAGAIVRSAMLAGEPIRAEKHGTGNNSAVSEIILSNIRVLAIGQNVQEKNGEKVVTGETATLELTPAQAEAIVRAHRVGQLSLALRSLADGTESGTPARDERSGGLTIIRYGVSQQAPRL